MNNDPLEGWEPKEECQYAKKMAKVFLLIISAAILFLVIVLVISAGCITAAKNTYAGIVSTPTPAPTIEITPEPTNNVSQNTVYPEVTERPQDFFYRIHGHFLDEEHCVTRENVTGIINQNAIMETMNLCYVVYDYEVLHRYYWYNVMDGQYYLQIPDQGKEFLFVFAETYSDADDVRPWAPDWDHVTVEVEGKLITRDRDYLPQIRIKEFEEKYDRQHVLGVRAFGFKQLTERGTGVESANPIENVFGGKSNSIDGYIPFQIPINTDISRVYVHIPLSNLGSPFWQLTNRPSDWY